MNFWNGLKVVLAFLACILALNQKSHSYAYNPWTSMTGEGVIAVNPFVYTPTFNPLTSGADFVASYGITPSVDVFADFAGVSFAPEAAYNYSWGMVRYDFGGNNIIALQASQLAVSPQYHFFWENDGFAAEANAYLTLPYVGMDSPVYGAYLAPVWKILKDVFYLYVEIDPSYTTGIGTALNIVPGVWFGLGSAGQISLACTLGDVLTGVTPGIAVWYWVSFDTKGKE